MTAIDTQRQFWNDWNAKGREHTLSEVSTDQAALTLRWLHGLSGKTILDVGCGTGWMSERLTAFGSVTATDLADDVLARAQARRPDICYVPGDFLSLDFPPCDIVVSFETLAHVADQMAFVDHCADIVKPGGMLILATQNPFVLKRCSWVQKDFKGLRRWVGKRELRHLLAPLFDVQEIQTITPDGDQGILRPVASPKVNRVLDAVLGAARVKRLKETCGIGRTLMVRAIRH